MVFTVQIQILMHRL